MGWTGQSRAWRLTQIPSFDSSASAEPSGDQVGPASPSSAPVAQPVDGSGTAGLPERASATGYQKIRVSEP